MGGFSLLAININRIIADLESQNQVAAYVDEACRRGGRGP